MAGLVLKNVSSMDVYIPTPNGAGRKIAPGQCVEGSFFSNLLNMKHMATVDPNSVDAADILCKYDHITANLLQTGKEVLPVTPVVVQAAPAPVQEAVAPVVVSEPIESAEPAEPVVEVKPKAKELSKYNLEELKAAAVSIGLEVSEDATRRSLINALIAKDYKV